MQAKIALEIADGDHSKAKDYLRFGVLRHTSKEIELQRKVEALQQLLREAREIVDYHYPIDGYEPDMYGYPPGWRERYDEAMK